MPYFVVSNSCLSSYVLVSCRMYLFVVVCIESILEVLGMCATANHNEKSVQYVLVLEQEINFYCTVRFATVGTSTQVDTESP